MIEISEIQELSDLYIYKIDLKDTINLLQNDFIEYEGCILFNHKIKFKKNIWREYNNRSQFEAFENHIHMSDYILNKTGLILLDFGLAVVHVLALKLKSVFPKYKFRIIVSYDLINEFGYNDCVIRFHKLRKNENCLAEDLEDYKQDAIGYLDV